MTTHTNPSAYEVGQLKSALRSSQAREARLHIIVSVLQRLFRERGTLYADAATFEEKVRNMSEFADFPVYMRSIPDVCIELTPSRESIDKHFELFRVFHRGWRDVDGDLTFAQYLERLAQQVDAEEE
jgi:hypothetical protein